MTNLKILFGFRGRIRRLQWWIGSICVFGIVLAMILIASMLVMAAYGDLRRLPPVGNFVFGTMLLAIYVGLLWSQLALGVKRLHDRESSGWWLLIGFIPIGWIVLLVMLGFLDGTQGPNKYGRSPKGIGGRTDDRELGSIFS